MAIFCMRCYVRRSDSQPRWLFIFSPCHRFVEWENIGYRLSFKQSLLALLLRWFMYALASISNSISAQPNISKLKSTETIGQYVNFPCSYWTNWTERESILTVRWKQEKKLNINFARPIIQRSVHAVGIRYGGIEINKTQWDVKGNKFEWKRVPNLIGNLSPERDDSHKERKKLDCDSLHKVQFAKYKVYDTLGKLWCAPSSSIVPPFCTRTDFLELRILSRSISYPFGYSVVLHILLFGLPLQSKHKTQPSKYLPISGKRKCFTSANIYFTCKKVFDPFHFDFIIWLWVWHMPCKMVSNHHSYPMFNGRLKHNFYHQFLVRWHFRMWPKLHN